jgi:two-component system, chemotaxis family, chemotaxis protein CheY
LERTVLVVDDAAFMRMLLRDILSTEGYVVHEAVDADDALERYLLLRPDVVTMDVTMPGSDGIEAVRRITALDSSARVIVVSALGDPDIVASALDAGAYGYLVKPFQPDQVLALVHGALDTGATSRPERLG